jgi:hypothetical protein
VLQHFLTQVACATTESPRGEHIHTGNVMIPVVMCCSISVLWTLVYFSNDCSMDCVFTPYELFQCMSIIIVEIVVQVENFNDFWTMDSNRIYDFPLVSKS